MRREGRFLRSCGEDVARPLSETNFSAERERFFKFDAARRRGGFSMKRRSRTVFGKVCACGKRRTIEGGGGLGYGLLIVIFVRLLEKEREETRALQRLSSSFESCAIGGERRLPFSVAGANQRSRLPTRRTTTLSVPPVVSRGSRGRRNVWTKRFTLFKRSRFERFVIAESSVLPRNATGVAVVSFLHLSS